METEFQNIIEKFLILNRRGYIPSISHNLINAAGLTLENCLGKKADSMFFPDYEGIEIKCTQRYSEYDISLFSLSFDGPALFESNYLLENYGIADEIFPEYRKLIVRLKVNQKVAISDKYYFELVIDKERTGLYIKIYDINLKFIEDRAFIDLDSLEQRAQLKLNKLALFYASKKKIAEELFFRYYKLECYCYKGIENFITCLERGDIRITLLLRFARSGKAFGKSKNKGMVFSVRKGYMEKVFDQIYCYER